MELHPTGAAAISALISVGDTLLSVDGEDIQGLTVEDIAPRIKGPVGSHVVLGVTKCIFRILYVYIPLQRSLILFDRCVAIVVCIKRILNDINAFSISEFARRGYPEPFTVELTRKGMKSSSSSQADPSSSQKRADSSSSSSHQSRLKIVADPRSASGLKGLPPGWEALLKQGEKFETPVYSPSSPCENGYVHDT